jgi:very-short-patch-repair endonuclease
LFALSGGPGGPLINSDTITDDKNKINYNKITMITEKQYKSRTSKKNIARLKKLAAARRGIPLTEAHKMKLRGRVSWAKGKKIWSEEQKENMRGEKNNASKYLKNKTYEEIYGVEEAKKQKEKREEHYKYLRQSATIHLKGKTYEEIYGHEKSEERKEKRGNQIFPMINTSIEVKLQNYLKQINIGFFTHYYCKEILHKYQCDFFIPVQKNRNRFIQQPIILECDGDYWHGSTLRFPNPSKDQQEQMKEDSIRTKELEAKGFRVIRLWEHEIKKLDLNSFKNIIELPSQ